MYAYISFFITGIILYLLYLAINTKGSISTLLHTDLFLDVPLMATSLYVLSHTDVQYFNQSRFSFPNLLSCILSHPSKWHPYSLNCSAQKSQNHLCLCYFFPPTIYLMHRQILSILSSKYIQNQTNLYYLHCYHFRVSQHHLS